MGKNCVVLGCRIKAKCPLVGPEPIGGVLSVGIFLRDPRPHLREFQRKTTENSERLGRQARPGIEPGTTRQPVSSAEPLRHWWGVKIVI